MPSKTFFNHYYFSKGQYYCSLSMQDFVLELFFAEFLFNMTSSSGNLFLNKFLINRIIFIDGWMEAH